MPSRNRNPYSQSQQNLQDEVIARAANEIRMDSKTLAEALSGDLPKEDVVSKGRQAYLEHFRANWDDPSWRTEELDRIGPHNFLHASYAAFGLKEPDWNNVTHIPQEGLPQADIGPLNSGFTAPGGLQ